MRGTTECQFSALIALSSKTSDILYSHISHSSRFIAPAAKPSGCNLPVLRHRNRLSPEIDPCNDDSLPPPVTLGPGLRDDRTARASA